MHDALSPLLDDGVVEEVVARLKSGKEADLWLVRHAGEIVAAKVYKAREARNFKNNAGYREGRQVRDTRMQRAMARGSRFGQAAAEDAWKTKESDALHQLHAAGVRVPRPVMFYEGVLLMEVVVDAEGHPAPRLVDAGVTREAAAAMYADLRAQVVAMLCHDLIHGDLSPYNILVGHAGPVIIDFPQVVGAAHNSQAERYFTRDLENVRGFFAELDPALRAAAGDAREIWRAYVRRELTRDFVPSGRSVEPPRREPHAQPHGQGGHGGHAGHRGQRGPGPGQGQPQGQRPGQERGQRPAQGQGQRPGQGERPGQGPRPGQGGPRAEQRGGPQPPRGPQRPQGSQPPQAAAQPPRGPQPPRGSQPPQRGPQPAGGQGPRPQQRRGPDRRPSSGPEVIRVVRPALPGSAPSGSAPGQPAGDPHRGQGHGGQGSGHGQGGHGGHGHGGHGHGHGGHGRGGPGHR